MSAKGGKKAGKGVGGLKNDNPNAFPIVAKKNKGGNPNLKKGVNNPRGENDPAGPIVAPGNKLKVFIPRLANFMEEEGWALLENAARVHGSKNQMPALKMAASYGYGDAPSASGFTADGEKIMSVLDFLNMKAEKPSEGAEGSGGD